METQMNGIKIRECADLGPVIARADHRDRAIEVNRKIFYGLPPMVQEFVQCHEVCHLEHNEHDEARTNMLASELFMQRARSDADRRARADFLAYLNGKEGDYSGFDVAAIVAIASGVVTLGSTVYGIIRQRNAGWYSWDEATRQANLRVMLTTAFEESRKSSEKSARDFFWEQLQQYDFKDDGYDSFAARTENAWVNDWVARYEKRYGFGFGEVTPVDLLAFTGVKLALGALAGLAVYTIVKRTIVKRK